ncbi:MAG TPA: transposase, partial [Streptosporangiaceae bacterium]|nr:transposase [Streptosporangiaceae bacterium]
PLIPAFAPRPQGGGTAPADDRAVVTAIVYVLASGCAWRHRPAQFGGLPGHRAPPVRRLPHSQSRPHLLQETHHMRHL